MSEKRPKVVLTHWVQDEVLTLLGQHADVVPNPTRESWPQEELLRHCRDADALIVFMPDRIGADFLRECPKLRIVAGALKGYDNIDPQACTDAGVWLSVVPDLLTVPTAELAVGLLLALTRRIPAGDRLIRSGTFQGWRPTLYGEGLAGTTVGILGYGRVGQTIARRLSGFDVELVFHDVVETLPVHQSVEGPERVDLETLLRVTDHLITAAPLNDSTLHLLNADRLRQMKPGATLVNIGRGSVVNEEDVAQALEDGHLAGYAADVFEMEDLSLEERPPEICEALLGFPERTVFTPHLGSAVASVREAIALEAAWNVVDALEGRVPRGAVDELSLEHGALT
ncbi:MAG: phosphonate dehydrogenase [Acidobacteriota bacterium]